MINIVYNAKPKAVFYSPIYSLCSCNDTLIRNMPLDCTHYYGPNLSDGDTNAETTAFALLAPSVYKTNCRSSSVRARVAANERCPCISILISPAAKKNCRNSLDDDLDIQPDRPIANIKQIKTNPFLVRDIRLSSHLPKTGQTWLNGK